MSERVVSFPRMSLPWAREVVAHQNVHRGIDIIAACHVLIDEGSADDVREARKLLKDGLFPGFEGAAIRAGRPRRTRRQVIGGLYLLIAAAIGTAVIASWIFTLIGMVLP